MTIGIGEHRRIGNIIQKIVGRVVVNAQALFLDHGVVADRIQLQAGRQRDRPQRAMQSQAHVIAFRHRGDLAGFGDAAGMAGIGLDNIHQTVAEDGLEIPARE
jgi:hypothetical protein